MDARKRHVIKAAIKLGLVKGETSAIYRQHQRERDRAERDPNFRPKPAASPEHRVAVNTLTGIASALRTYSRTMTTANASEAVQQIRKWRASMLAANKELGWGVAGPRHWLELANSKLKAIEALLKGEPTNINGNRVPAMMEDAADDIAVAVRTFKESKHPRSHWG